MSKMAKTVDDLVKEVGGCGLFQMILVPLVFSSVVMSVWSMMLMVFGALEPDWWCVSRDLLRNASRGALSNMSAGGHFQSGEDSRVLKVNVSSVVWGGDIGVHTGGMDNSTYKVCGEKVNHTGRCERIFFDPSMNTVVSQFQLVCDLAWVPSMTISAQMVGVLVGSTVAGQLADNLGRKKTLVSISTLHAVFNLVCAFSVNWQMFAVMRSLVGLTIGGLLASSFAYPTEFIGIKWRAVIGSIPTWGIGAASFSLMVWLIQDWQHLHFATAVCTAACLPAWIFLPESVRWLSIRGRLTEAHDVFRKMARLNRRKAPSLRSIQHLYTDTGKAPKKYNSFHLFSSRDLCKSSILLGFMWFSCSLCYYGISFGIKNFAGNFYLNFFLLSIVEVPPSLLVYHFCKWFGRRWTVAGSFMVSTLSIFSVIPVTLLLSIEEGGVYVNGLCMAARMSMNLGWNAMTLFVAELYPTVVRNISIGYCNTTARLGGIIAPYILSAGEPYVFFLVIGVAMTMTFISPLFLRETRGRPLEDELPVSPRKMKSTLAQADQKELQTMM